MLTFRRLQAQNFCQHQSLDLEFSPGLVGIIGPNGSGKSNLVKALFRALTGKSLNPGRKEDDISWGADAGSLELDFTIDGVEANLKRDLKTERCSMTIGKDKYRKSTEIAEKLYPFLGVSPRVLADVVFVMQGQIEGMLFQQPAKRIASFQHLFGTQNAERVRELLHDDLTNLSVESRDDQIKQFRRKLEEEVEPPLKEALETIETWNVFQLSDERRGEIEKVLNQRRRAEFSRERLKEVEPAFERADKEVKGAESNILHWSVKVEGAENTLAELKPDFDRAKGLMQAAKSCEELAVRRATLRAEVTRCESVLASVIPDCEVTEREVEVAQDKLAALEGEYRHYELLVGAGKPNEKVNHCPTCGQEVNEGHIVEAVMKIDRMKGPLAKLREAAEDAIRIRQAFNYRSVEHRTQQRGAREHLNVIRPELGALPEVEEVDAAEVVEARKVVEAYEKFEESAEELEMKRRVAQDTLKALDSGRQERFLEQNALRADVDKDPGVEAISGARETLDKAAEAGLAIERAIGIRDSLLKQKFSLSTQLTQWEAEEVKLVRLRIWRERVENARRLLHRDALPGEVARSYMDALNERLSYYLELFASPFTAEIAADTLITCRFSGRPEVPSERLSGGQKVVLGVAFRFAIYDLFVAGLGVMLLDEPTAYLDDDNVSAIAQLLTHLKGFSKSAGIQLIVPTHEQQLVYCFDQVISLGS